MLVADGTLGSGNVDVPPDEINVGSTISVIDMPAMTIGTLDALGITVMADFGGVTVSTDVARRSSRSSEVGPEQVPFGGGKFAEYSTGAVVEGTAVGVGVMHFVASGAKHLAVDGVKGCSIV